MGKYATVVVDPPWPLPGFGFVTNENTRENHSRKGNDLQPLSYNTLTIGDIESLPICDVLADDATLFCWTVNKWLPHTFAMVEVWGCKYSFTMTWVKNGGIQTPITPQFNSEWCIVARKGNPKWEETKAFRAANFWEREGHSVKPTGFYDLLRRVTPGPRLDIFGRRRIAGFDSWGNEAPEGPALPSHYQGVFA